MSGNNSTGDLNTLWNNILQEIRNFKDDKIIKKEQQERWERLQNNILELKSRIIEANNNISKEYLQSVEKEVQPVLNLFNSMPKHKNNRNPVNLNEIGKFLKAELVEPVKRAYRHN